MSQLLNMKQTLTGFLGSLVAPVQMFEAETLHSLCQVNGRTRTVPEKKSTDGLGAQAGAGSGCPCSLRVVRVQEARRGGRATTGRAGIQSRGPWRGLLSLGLQECCGFKLVSSGEGQ